MKCSILQFTWRTVLCTVYCALYLYSVPGVLYCVLCTVYCALYLYSVPGVVQCVLYSLPGVLSHSQLHEEKWHSTEGKHGQVLQKGTAGADQTVLHCI